MILVCFRCQMWQLRYLTCASLLAVTISSAEIAEKGSSTLFGFLTCDTHRGEGLLTYWAVGCCDRWRTAKVTLCPTCVLVISRSRLQKAARSNEDINCYMVWLHSAFCLLILEHFWSQSRLFQGAEICWMLVGSLWCRVSFLIVHFLNKFRKLNLWSRRVTGADEKPGDASACCWELMTG